MKPAKYAPRLDPSVMLSFRDMWDKTPQGERDSFVSKLKVMPYAEFLQSQYWGMLRGWLLSVRDTCQFCRSPYYLNLHHRTYEHRGEEFLYPNDLEVLCGDCHRNRHGKASLEQVEAITKRRLNAWRNGSEEDRNERGLDSIISVLRDGV